MFLLYDSISVIENLSCSILWIEILKTEFLLYQFISVIANSIINYAEHKK
jgi:hypothetical protein